MTSQELASEMVQLGVTPTRIREFINYLKRQPVQWQLFCDAMLQELKEAETLRISQVSAKAAFERMRKTSTARVAEFKVDNNFHSLMARAFIIKYPIYRDKIELRELKRA